MGATRSRSPSRGWPRPIRLGLVATGERLPPERTWPSELQVSRVTLREAIGALREAGYLESRRGRGGGTFVVWHGGDGAGGTTRTPPSWPGRWARRCPTRWTSGGCWSRARPRWRPAVPCPAVDRAAARRLPGRRRARPRPGRPGGSTTPGCTWPSRPPAVSPSLAAAVADVQLTPGPAARRDPGAQAQPRPLRRPARPVVEAILAGDAATARAAMEEHCDATAELLRGLLG